MENIAKKVSQYESFLNETLKEDLKYILQQRDKIYGELSEYLQLKSVIERIKEGNYGAAGLKTKVDLGCNFYVQANVLDSSKILVCVGFGFFVEFTLEEAIAFIDRKVKHLNAISDSLTKDCAKIKAHMKLLVEALQEIQGFDSDNTEKNRPELEPL